MQLKQIGNETSLVAAHFKIDQPVTFAALYLHLSGLGHATGTHSLDHLGRLKYRIRGKSIIDCDVEYLIALAKLKYGFNAVTFTTAGLIDIGILIPRWFGQKEPDNVEHILKDDNAELEVQWGAGLSAGATAPAAFTATLYAVLHEGINVYHLTMHQIAESLAANQLLTETYNAENILGVYIADVLSDLLTTVGGFFFAATAAAKGRLDYTIGHKHGNACAHAWRAGNDIFNKGVEAVQVAPCCCELYNAEGDQINNKLHDQILVNITNGSGGTATPQFLLVGAQFNPYKLAETQARQISLFNQKLADKELAGHSRAVALLRKVAERVGS